MQTDNPYDANNQFFKFNNQNANVAPSAFSFQYNPSIITAYSANPNANIAGGINPTQNQLATLQPQAQDNSQQTSPTSLIQPKLINYSQNIQSSGSGQSQQSSPSSLNSNAVNLLSSAAQQSGVGKSVLGGLTSSINNFGMGLGFGSGGGASEAISPALAAADPSLVASGASVSEGAASAGSLSGATLSATLGAAALGFIGGGILAGALGENSTGGSIGGGIGAGIGFAVAGPIGALIGGVGGSIFGGMFGGNKPATAADTYSSYLAPDGTMTFREHGAKNPGQYAGYGQQVANQFGQLSSAMAKDLGIQYAKDSYISSGISTLHGGAYITDNQGNQIFYDVSNPADQQRAFKQALETSALNSGFTDKSAVDNWFAAHQGGGQATEAVAPSIPNNPHGSEDQNSWQQFLSNYKAQQNANAAPAS